MSFWQDKLQVESAPAQPRSLGEEYRAWQSGKMGGNGSSGSMVYSREYQATITGQRGAPKVSIYEDAPVRTLDDYASAPVTSKWAQKPGQSDQDYVAKLKPYIHALAEKLPADELAAVAEAYNSAVQRLEGGVQSHTDLRQHLDSKADGTGRGVMGSASPTERAALVSSGSPTSMAAINEARRAREAQLRAQPVQHSDLGGLRSTGSGFMGVDR